MAVVIAIVFIVGFAVLALVVETAITKPFIKSGKRAKKERINQAYASETQLCSSIWRIESAIPATDVFHILQPHVITGNANDGKIYIESAQADRIIYAYRIKRTIIGFTAQLNIMSANNKTVVDFSFTKWSFSSGPLPFLKEMNNLINWITGAFRLADNLATVHIYNKQ